MNNQRLDHHTPFLLLLTLIALLLLCASPVDAATKKVKRVFDPIKDTELERQHGILFVGKDPRYWKREPRYYVPDKSAKGLSSAMYEEKLVTLADMQENLPDYLRRKLPAPNGGTKNWRKTTPGGKY